MDEIFDRGLHQYLDKAQTKLNDIGDALFRAYIFQPFQNPDGEHMVQQEEQQQQRYSASSLLNSAGPEWRPNFSRVIRKSSIVTHVHPRRPAS